MTIRKRYFFRNGLLMGIIILLAVFSTYIIYNMFNKERHVNYISKSLDIVFHEKTGAQINITKITPVVDAVGLSSKGYSFTVTNNLTIPITFKIKLVDDKKQIKLDNCKEDIIPKDNIKLSINAKNNKDSEIQTIDMIEDNIVGEYTLPALASYDYTIRVWIKNDTELVSGSKKHYHGLIQIAELDDSIAIIDESTEEKNINRSEEQEETEEKDKEIEEKDKENEEKS